MKRYVKVLLVLALVVATVACTLLFVSCTGFGKFEPQVSTDAVTYKMQAIEQLLNDYFIGEYDLQTLEAAAADGAADAMIAATGDRWSFYISAEEMQSYQEQMNNSYVGIGVTIQETETGMEIMSVTKGSPAEEAGVLVGDICVSVEGKKTVELGLEGTQEVVRGEAGTYVNMRFSRDGEEFDLKVERRAIVTAVAELEMLQDDVALITIHNFDRHCAEQTLNCIDEALSRNAKALLFDVRFNGGGLKDEMVLILDELLPEGELFRSVDYRGVEEVDTSDAECIRMPMAVLVNEDSYSAAEFFAAALQEYGVAKVIGTQTSGKGNFQYTLELGDGSAVALSVGKYVTPNGKSLTDVGITPDVIQELNYEDNVALYYGNLAHEDDEQLQKALDALK